VDHHVKAVVAVSPFVGLTDVASWAGAHPTLALQGDVFGQLARISAAYGQAIHSAAYRERSPDASRITAPVLLLQGTADHHVAWQTVLLFAHQMEAAHRTVKLVLYPGGHHGRYSAKSNAQIDRWFARYGLRLNFGGH
jgi:alpha-beta hydrolase superfamily lysophospholipase